jgi:2-amino-4-hydroxy-6-hydroxymethyldihydropteridine diphosphokinase
MIKIYKSYLSLGSNVGDRESNIAQAITALGVYDGINNFESSSLYLTEPLYNLEQEYFINAVIGIETSLNPFTLLDAVKKIEIMLGRKIIKKKNMPRIIDIDILVHGDSIIETSELVIPHPFISQRKFVLIPFDEIAPDYKIPLLNSSIHELLVSCKDESSVRLHDMEYKA